MPTDNDYLIAISRYLSDDVTLYGLVDGHFEVNYPATEVLKELGNSATNTLISVCFASRMSYGRLGSYTSHLKEVKPIIQIDVASMYGGNASYCEQVVDRVEDIIYYDIEYTLGSDNYHVYVKDITTKVFWDSEIKCWHGVVSITGWYLRQTT